MLRLYHAKDDKAQIAALAQRAGNARGVVAGGLAAHYEEALNIGWDLYAEFTGAGDSRINVVAHLSGAATGFIVGVTVFRQKRHWTLELIEEKD